MMGACRYLNPNDQAWNRRMCYAMRIMHILTSCIHECESPHAPRLHMRVCTFTHPSRPIGTKQFLDACPFAHYVNMRAAM